MTTIDNDCSSCGGSPGNRFIDINRTEEVAPSAVRCGNEAINTNNEKHHRSRPASTRGDDNGVVRLGGLRLLTLDIASAARDYYGCYLAASSGWRFGYLSSDMKLCYIKHRIRLDHQTRHLYRPRWRNLVRRIQIQSLVYCLNPTIVRPPRPFEKHHLPPKKALRGRHSPPKLATIQSK